MSHYMQQLLNCDLQDVNNEVLRKSTNRMSLINTDDVTCRVFPRRGVSIKRYQEICNDRGFTAVKVISVFSLSQLLELIQSGVKVLHLVRDPRSNWLSQMNLLAYKTDVAKGPLWKYLFESIPYSMTKTTCPDLNNDLSLLEDLSDATNSFSNHSNMYTHLLNNYRIVRYEDIASRPQLWAKSMYRFLGLQSDSRIEDWIRENTILDEPKG